MTPLRSPLYPTHLLKYFPPYSNLYPVGRLHHELKNYRNWRSLMTPLYLTPPTCFIWPLIWRSFPPYSTRYPAGLVTPWVIQLPLGVTGGLWWLHAIHHSIRPAFWHVFHTTVPPTQQVWLHLKLHNYRYWRFLTTPLRSPLYPTLLLTCFPPYSNLYPAGLVTPWVIQLPLVEVSDDSTPFTTLSDPSSDVPSTIPFPLPSRFGYTMSYTITVTGGFWRIHSVNNSIRPLFWHAFHPTVTSTQQVWLHHE